MARRLGLLTAVGGLGLALARLGRLLQPQLEGPAWEVVLVASALLAAVLTWATLTSRWPGALVLLLNAVGAVLAVLRVAAPTSLRGGVLPTAETLPELQRELSFAVELIRFGSAPVIPVAGLIAVLAAVFWGLGALIAHGVARERWAAVTLPALVLYLQLATLDRRPPGLGWMVAFTLLGAGALLALGAGPDPRTGRFRDPVGRLLPRRSGALPVASLVVMLAAGVGAGSAFAAMVPESGVIDWRAQSGIGSGLYGGRSFNLFVGLQQDLVDLGEDPLFYARVSDSAPPNRDLYWRLITLDSFDGDYWTPTDQPVARRGRDRWERDDLRFQGPTVPVAARVRIAELSIQLLPILYSTSGLQSDEDLIGDTFRVREDGAVAIDVRTKQGWEYEIRADVPRPDIAHLASVGGELSPIFREASDEGAFAAQAVQPRFQPRPDDVDHFLALPDGIPTEVRELAREVTEPGLTRFEKALILEAWFRDPEIFTYSVDVSTGHSSLDLADWLLDPESRNFRTGYCEQFATAFAVMARSLRIPSRVVLGFTPGDVETQSDGSELIVVRERNAHAWVELWMDGQGWVRFDPTPRSDGANAGTATSQVGFDPRAYLPAPSETDAGAGAGRSFADSPELRPEIDLAAGDPTPSLVGDTGRLGLPAWVWWALTVAGVAALVPAGKLLRRRRRLARMRSGDVTAAWEEIVDRLRDLGAEVRGDETPLEIARRQHPDLVPLAALHTAAAYGGRRDGDGAAAFRRAEEALLGRYERSRRLGAWLALASLRDR